jgi:hypothetical protein
MEPKEIEIDLLSDYQYRMLVEVEHQVIVKIMEDRSGPPSILSMDELAIIHQECNNKHQLIDCFTPILDILSNECLKSSLGFVLHQMKAQQSCRKRS